MTVSTAKRHIALDFFRGITIAAMILVNTPGSWDHVYAPLLHSPWEGWTLTDLIFPFFLFIVGVSMWFSFKKYPSGLNIRSISKIIKRSLLIFLIGLFLTWFPFYDLNLENLRFVGVLQRIAVSYLFASVICIGAPRRWIPFISLSFLLAYWGWIYLVAGSEDYAKEYVFQQGIDHVSFRSCLSSSVAIMLGYLAGDFVDQTRSRTRKLFALVAAGSAMTVIGLLWGELFPIIKSVLWTSSYLMFSVGIATVTFAACLWIFEDEPMKKWATPFVVFGRNPLFIYALSILVDEMTWLIQVGTGEQAISLHEWLYNQLFRDLGGLKNGSLLYAICFVALNWLIAYWMYQKGKFIKV
jgi:predicted acyltransferase